MKQYYALVVAAIACVMIYQITGIAYHVNTRESINFSKDIFDTSNTYIKMHAAFQSSMFKMGSALMSIGYRQAPYVWRKLYPDRNQTLAEQVSTKAVGLLATSIGDVKTPATYEFVRYNVIVEWIDDLGHFIGKLSVISRNEIIYRQLLNAKLPLAKMNSPGLKQYASLLSSFRQAQAVTIRGLYILGIIGEETANQVPPYNLSYQTSTYLIPEFVESSSDNLFNYVRQIEPVARKVLVELSGSLDFHPFPILLESFIVGSVVFLSVIIWLVYRSRKVSACHHQLLAAYEFVKQHELKFLKHRVSKIKNTLKCSAFNEMKLTKLFQKASSTIKTPFGLQHASQDCLDPHRTTYKTRITITGTYRSAVIWHALLLVAVILVGSGIIATDLYRQKRALEINLRTRQFFLTHYMAISDSMTNFVKFMMFISMGNYVTINGQRPEKYVNASPAINYFTDIWTTQVVNIKQFMTEGEYARLQTIMFKDACSLLPQSDNGGETINRMCRSVQGTNQGFIGYLLHENSVVEQVSNSIRENNQTFLEKSKAEYMLPDNLELYMSEDMVILRLVHDYLTEAFNDWTYDLINSHGSKDLEDAQWWLKNVVAASSIILELGLVIFIVGSWIATKKELKVSSHTFDLLRPEVVSTNAMLSSLAK